MRTRIVLAACAAGAVLVMGCSVNWRTGDGSAGDSPAAAPSPSVDAAATAQVISLLREGTKFVDQTSFRSDCDVAAQITTLTHNDNAHKRADATVSISGKSIEIRMVGDEVYLRTGMDMAGVGHGWMILDPAKVPAGFALSFAPGKNDPGGSARLIDAIVSAQLSGREITGTMDLTKVGTGNGISIRPRADGGYPDSARSQPFRATLDDQGRLVSFLIPGQENSPGASLRYSDFGAAVDVLPPTGAIPAPEALYPQLGLH